MLGDMSLMNGGAKQRAGAEHGHPSRPLFWTSALGIAVIIGGTVLLAGLAAFLIALTSSGSFALWAIEVLLNLAGA